MRTPARLRTELGQLPACRKGHMVDLGKVVVFAGKPENGHMWSALRSALARPGDRRCRLEGRKERSAEETHLLPGQDGSSAPGKSGNRIFLSREPILHGDQVNQLRPVRGKRRPLRVRPIRRQKRAKRSRAEIHEEACLPRHHGYGITVCGRQFVHLRLACLKRMWMRTRKILICC